MNISISESRNIDLESIIRLYKANKWSSANEPGVLYKALMNSHTLVIARDGNILVGLGNAISDGHLVVYYPHLLVHPDYQGQGIGKKIFRKIQKKYINFHMQILVSDGEAIDFYTKFGFKKAGNTQPMWIYQGNEH